MRTLILGDVHGELDKLKQVLKLAKYTPEDRVIQLGDVVDRGPHPFECMDILMEMPNRILIRGNHDEAFIDFIRTGKSMLIHSGADVTIREWEALDSVDKARYVDGFFNQQIIYYVDTQNRLYVHGGYDRNHPIEECDPLMCMWDRSFWNRAMSCKGDQKLNMVGDYKEVYIGHTPTAIWGQEKPMYAGGVWNIDTGCGKGGPLCCMDVDTHEYWLSDRGMEDDEEGEGIY